MKYNPPDIDFINNELDIFFVLLTKSRIPKLDRMFKYKKRFYDEKNKIVRHENRRPSERLSLGKKLEILCTYADFDIVKRKNTFTSPKRQKQYS